MLSSLFRLAGTLLATVGCLSLFLAPVAHAFTVGEEKELGEKLLSLVRKEFKVLDDPDISQYINRLGREVLEAAGPQFFNYHFFVIRNRQFNAFAAPSGLIFIHSGLIEVTETEDELVSVIAHEIAHAASRHYADRLEKAKKVSMGSAALALAGLAMGAGPLSEALVTGSMAASATLQLKFSRQDEEEADRLAYKWMRQIGRDPHEMLGMLGKMRRISRYRSGSIPPYLLTHPEPEKRLAYIEDRIYLDQALNDLPPRHDPFSFLRIKYRILTLTREPHELLDSLLRKAGEGEESEHLMARYGLAQVYLANRDYRKAEKELRQVKEKLPDKPLLDADLAIILFEAGKHAEALALIDKASQKAPEEAYIQFQRARILQQTGKTQEALAIYRKLVQSIPDYSRLHYRLGELEAALGNKNGGHYHLGVYFWQEGDVKNARFHLKETIRNTQPDDALRQKAEELLATMERLEKM